jgi:RNA polymerase sigma factor (sigma-70 family)
MPDHKCRFLHETFLLHAREVGAFVRGRWPGEPDVADIVQESFLRLSQYPDPQAIRNPRAFLFQTAANLVVDLHRRRVTRDRYAEADTEPDSVADTLPGPAQHWENHATLEQFAALLEQLPEIRRHAFVLFRIEGMSHGEIAARLEISVRSSERHVMKAMQYLSRHLAPVGL